MTTSDKPIYLDHNATTPVLPEVLEEMMPFLRGEFGNPSSDHAYGRRARKAVEDARRRVAALIGAEPDEIVFTSGGTESNNLGIRGAASAIETGESRHLITSRIEHPAVDRPCRRLRERGWKLNRVPVNPDGRLDVDTFEQMRTPATELVTVMCANNETGVIQPVAECVDRAGEAIVHTDAAQAVGKIEVDVDELGIDLLTIAGHKMYGPKGVGALYIRAGTPIRPLLVGSCHEHGLRPGTENVASIAGLGKACEIASRSLIDEKERVQKLRDELWERLRGEIDEIRLNGDFERRLPNTLNVRFPEVRGSSVLALASEVAASSGSACSEGDGRASSAITALGVPKNEALGSVRLSLGRKTTQQKVERAADALVDAWRSLVGD